MSLFRAAAPTLFLALVPSLALADRITLADGTEIADVKIEQESLSVVTYDKQETVPSDNVRSVEFEKFPPLVDQALAALRGGDAGAAADMLDEYVSDRGERGDSRYPWGPAYAAWTGIELRQQFADLPGVVEKASAFTKTFEDSRYLPMAFLAKTRAELALGKADVVAKTLADFRAVISSRSLSARWSLEADLMEARAAGGSLSKQRAALDAIVDAADGEHPGVANRARVAIGEALLGEAEKSVSDPAKASGYRSEAQGLFEAIVADPAADDTTLAGAYTGLGECLFYAGADSQDPELLGKAVRALLRVPVVYEAESAYVPRALFLAGRSFDMLQDRDRKRDMRRELERSYPNSPWTEEARRIL